jgi:hypothetical protein
MARAIDDPAADLRRRARRAQGAELKAIARAWWRDHELGRVPVGSCRRIAAGLIDDSPALAIAVLQQLGEQLRVADLPLLARVAATDPRAIARLLALMLARDDGRAELAHAIADWRDAPTSAQRCAACGALASLAPRGDAAFAGFTALALSLCATIVWSHADDDQAAVGALLGKLAAAAPAHVDGFVRRYARLMSRPCARLAVAKLPARDELLAHHRRATSI